MPILIICPCCNSRVRAPDAAAGHKGRCPKCGAAFTVPGGPEPKPPAPTVEELLRQKAELEAKLLAAGLRHAPSPADKAPGLVRCKVCGSQVARSAVACPACGVGNPGTPTGKLVIVRSSAVTGGMYALSVYVDGELRGEMRNGDRLSLDLAAGRRRVQVSGGWMSREAVVNIPDGQTVHYQMFFSEWGFLGGGLNFKPA